MKANVGSMDKLLRIVVGIALLSMIFVLQGNARWFGLIGLVPLLTAFVGYCPLYSIIGINTCPVSSTRNG